MIAPRNFGVALSLSLLPAAWLIPNHYPPWVSAWPDGLALALLAGAALTTRTPVRVARGWLVFAVVAAASIALQAALGRILFAGDALMAALYVGAFLLALGVGGAGAQPRGGGAPRTPGMAADGVALFALGMLMAALLCVAVALVQWTDVSVARGWIADLPPRERPFSNLGQPNHFNTAAFLGLAAAGVLRESGRIGATGFWSAAALLLSGMALSGSRTAWLQLAAALVLLPVFAQRAGRPASRAVLVAGGLLVLYAALLPAYAYLGELLGHDSRPAQDMLTSGTRPALWRDMLVAATHEPLLGHGWLQVGAAQQSAALARPPYFEQHDHAHNIVLDLVVWAGIPFGAALVLLGMLALATLVRRLRDPRAAWLLIGAFGVLAHGMLEFPLEYAYFLVPLGVMLGMVDAMAPRPEAPSPKALGVARSAWAARTGGALLAGLLAVIAVDYLKAEENFRLARLQTARIGTDRVTTEVPDLMLLTQLEAFLRFVRTEAKAGMAPEDLQWMHAVSLRFGSPPVLFRYALALGLNGRPQESAHVLRLLCQIHAARHCAEARATWQALQERRPALKAVPIP